MAKIMECDRCKIVVRDNETTVAGYGSGTANSKVYDLCKDCIAELERFFDGMPITESYKQYKRGQARPAEPATPPRPLYEKVYEALELAARDLNGGEYKQFIEHVMMPLVLGTIHRNEPQLLAQVRLEEAECKQELLTALEAIYQDLGKWKLDRDRAPVGPYAYRLMEAALRRAAGEK